LTLSNEKAEPPEIKLVVPLTPVQHLTCSVTAVNYPGAELLIRGKNFGNEPGWARIIGQFPTGIRMTLQILSWADNEIRAKIPIMKGIVDQTIRLQVGGGKMSNEWPIPFTALRERALLPASFGRVLWCGGRNGRSNDHCWFRDLQTHNVDAVHFPNGDTRTQWTYDNYTISPEIKNGWVIEGYEWIRGKGIRYQQVSLFSGCTVEKLSFTVHWDWGPNFGYASYQLKINMVGPAGIPY
jgi:hypothetical protein